MEQIEQDIKRNEGSFVVKKPREKNSEEERSLFADGLPDWDLIPPQVVVRRRKRS